MFGFVWAAWYRIIPLPSNYFDLHWYLLTNPITSCQITRAYSGAPRDFIAMPSSTSWHSRLSWTATIIASWLQPRQPRCQRLFRALKEAQLTKSTSSVQGGMGGLFDMSIYESFVTIASVDYVYISKEFWHFQLFEFDLQDTSWTWMTHWSPDYLDRICLGPSYGCGCCCSCSCCQCSWWCFCLNVLLSPLQTTWFRGVGML